MTFDYSLLRRGFRSPRDLTMELHAALPLPPTDNKYSLRALAPKFKELSAMPTGTPYGINPTPPQPKRRVRLNPPAFSAPYDGKVIAQSGPAVAAFFGGSKSGHVGIPTFRKPRVHRTVSLVPTNMNRTRCLIHGIFRDGVDRHFAKGGRVFYAQGYAEAVKGMALFDVHEVTLIEVERRRPRKESVTPRHRLPSFVRIVKEFSIL